jgi:hypothetical protein
MWKVIPIIHLPPYPNLDIFTLVKSGKGEMEMFI